MATQSQPNNSLQAKTANLRALLNQDSFKQQVALALPNHLTVDRLMRVAMTAVQKTPKLLDCTQISVCGAIVEAAQLGIVPDGILGQAYLVPYKGVCQLQIGYRGYLELARRSGQVSFVTSELVYECDQFSVELGTERFLKHVPDYDNPERGTFESGEVKGLKGAYAIVKYKDGAVDFEYMSKVMLDQIRATSKSGGSDFSPWNTHPAEMYRKVPIRRLAKRLPLSAEFMKAAVLDDYAEQGVSQGFEHAIDRNSELARQATENTANGLAEKYLPSAEDENQDAAAAAEAANEKLEQRRAEEGITQPAEIPQAAKGVKVDFEKGAK